jgi:hypothetical protein
VLRLPYESKPWFLTSAIAGLATFGLALRYAGRSVELRLHQVDPDGLVPASPEGLAEAAGAPLAVYSLASAMQSEEHTDRGRLAVGRATLNAAGEPQKIFHLLAPRGRFGAQTVNPYASTARPPTARTLGLAQALVNGRVPDFVEGAVKWDAPAAQDRAHALYLADPVRFPKYRLSAADIAARRRAEGLREVWIPGVPNTRFWTRS